MKKIITIVFLVVSLFNYSQDKSYARMVLDTLCSSHFDGRGYYNKGELRAANFIKGEYERFGLKKIKGDYFQNFNLSTNAIVGDLDLELNGEKIVPGVDYLVSPDSPSFFNKSKVCYISKNTFLNIEEFKKEVFKIKDRFIVIDKTLLKNESREVKNQIREVIQFLKFSKEVKLNGIIEIVEKTLTFRASQEKAERPHLIILKDKLPEKLKTIKLKVENEFNPNHSSQNVIGFIEGVQKDKFVYVTAHYDHLGRMGDAVYFPGANDNASGTAMLLSLAKEFAPEAKPKYSIVFICFGSEEIGLVGSKHYTENPLLPLENIQFLINLDILGTGDDGIQVVNGKKHPKEFENLVALNSSKDLLKEVRIRGTSCNSDHCFFSEKGVPSFFIYTLGGIAHYHNIYDKSETLPLTEYDDLFVLLKDFIISRE